MTVNTRLQENPQLQNMPTTQLEWTHYQNELAKWVRFVVKFGDGSITTSGGTTVSGLDEIEGSVHLGDGSIKTAVGTQIDGLDEMTGSVHLGDGSIKTAVGTQIDGLDEMTGSVHLGDGSIKTTGGTQIDGLDEMPGVLPDSDSLNTITAFNRGSTQSTSPLTAADVGETTTVTVAAHNLVYDSTTLAYSSGTVTGLAFSTLYYIYTDDPTKAGGAVTYVASTTGTDITANVGRYFIGEITTPADGAGDTGGGWGGGGGGGGGQVP